MSRLDCEDKIDTISMINHAYEDKSAEEQQQQRLYYYYSDKQD